MRRVVLTGTNRGLGLSLARCFQQRGWCVGALNRTLADVGWMEEERCDLADLSAIAPALGRLLDRMGGVDVCICNAAVRKLSLIAEMPADDWDQSVSVNLSAVFRLVQSALPALIADRGHLVLIGSQAATHPFEGGAAYCATKAALHALAEVIVMETRDLGVRTTLVSAGAIRNRPMQGDDWKIDPADMAETLMAMVEAPPSSFVGMIEVRPVRCLPPPVLGMERLQHI